MTTVAEFAKRDHVEIAYLLVMQGLPFMFTTRIEIAGSGAGSWIGTAYGPRRVIEGLDISGSTITFATELGDGRPDTDDGLTVKIIDFDRELIELFRVQNDPIPVGGRLGPKDDPAPATLIATSGDDLPIWGKWVNAEAIGPAGERSYYSLFPGGDPAGQDHAAYNGDIQTLAPSYVYDSPTHMEGRRVALYRIFRNVDTGEWPTWQDQHDSGYSLIWVGSMTNEVEARNIEWSIKFDGPSSWLRKQLGAQRDAKWSPVSGLVSLNTTPGEREDLFALGFLYQQVNQPAPELGASSIFTALDVLPAIGNEASFRGAINARIATVSATAGPDITWTASRHAEARLEYLLTTTRIDKLPEAANFVRAAVWKLAMHEKVWRALGYDPHVQAAENYDTEFEIKFITAEKAGLPAPALGYWVAVFWTVPEGYNSINSAGLAANNGGKPRMAKAIAPADIAQLPPGGKFELSFGIGSPGYLEGQTNRAPAEHELSNGGGSCDTQGYVAFRGSYVEGPDSDPVTMVQLAQICWRNDAVILGGDTIGLDADDGARVFIARWIDSRFHGCDCKPLSRVWATADLEWSPVNFFGHAFQSGDLAHRLLLRLMLSTGTATWTGFDGDGAVLTPGANHHPALVGIEPYSDAEIADLGLGIPHEVIDLHSFAEAAMELPSGGPNSPLNRCRYAWVGAQDSQELIAAVLAPRGWGMGFCNNSWRLFSRPAVLTAAKVEVAIEPSDIAGEPDFVENAVLRPFMPRERFRTDFSRALVAEAATDDRDLTLDARALDPGNRSRRDNGVEDVEGWGLIPIPLWRGAEPPSDWRPAWEQLFARTMGGWFNAAHIMIRGLPVLPSIAQKVGPGSVVRFSSYYAPTREGDYGPTAKLGRVYKVEHDLESREAKIDVLLQPGDASSTKLFAPLAAVLDMVDAVEERHDASARTFYCYADWARHGNALMRDVEFFTEPPWSGIGGDAVVHGYQHDGRTWSQTFSFTVESVSTAANTITYKPGSLVGKWWEARYTMLLLAPFDDQPADSWTRQLFAVITRPDFKFGAVPTQGFKLV